MEVLVAPDGPACGSTPPLRRVRAVGALRRLCETQRRRFEQVLAALAALTGVSRRATKAVFASDANLNTDSSWRCILLSQ